MKTILKKDFYTRAVFPLAWLALPLVFSGLVESSIAFFSTIFLAHLGEQALAAGALVSWVFATLMVILWGTLTAVSVLVAQKHGAKDHMGASFVLRDAVVLALIFVIPTFCLLWNLAPILSLMGQRADIIALAQSYLHGLAWGIVPDFIMLVLLQFMIGLGHTRLSLTFMLLWVPVAIFCNYVLIFGKFGFPALGIAGIGWGMTMSYWLSTTWIILYLFINPLYKQYCYDAFSLATPSFLKELLQIGAPMGFMYCIEIGFFLALTVLMGLIGSEELAANQIVLQYLGILMAVIFSSAQALTVRVGYLIGAGDLRSAMLVNKAGIVLSLAFIGVVSIIYLLFPDQLIAIDLDITDPANAGVIANTKQFMLICVIFQVLEAIRITLFGSLRAMKDTHYTLLTSILSFWIIALPLGYYLSRTSLAGSGLWWGMCVGAACSVVLLGWRLRFRQRQFSLTR